MDTAETVASCRSAIKARRSTSNKRTVPSALPAIAVLPAAFMATLVIADSQGSVT